MELLKQRIRKDGTVKGNDVLKVDSVLMLPFLRRSARSLSGCTRAAA